MKRLSMKTLTGAAIRLADKYPIGDVAQVVGEYLAQSHHGRDLQKFRSHLSKLSAAGEVVVEVAHPLDVTTEKQLQGEIAHVWPGILISMRINLKLVTGFRIQHNGRVFDQSGKKLLKDLSMHLAEVKNG